MDENGEISSEAAQAISIASGASVAKDEAIDDENPQQQRPEGKVTDPS